MAKILVIDDSASILETIVMILTEAGHDIVRCTSGRGAIPMLREEPFELVITDIYMPDGDGLELMGAVRKIHPKIPVIAMSGMSGNWNMLDVARHMGACYTLRKPFSKSQLLQAVGRALGAPIHKESSHE